MGSKFVYYFPLLHGCLLLRGTVYSTFLVYNDVLLLLRANFVNAFTEASPSNGHTRHNI
jgi:hypothetical protein